MASQKRFEGIGWDSPEGKVPGRGGKVLVVQERVDGIRQGYWNNAEDLADGDPREVMKRKLNLPEEKISTFFSAIDGWTRSSRGRRAAYLRGAALRLMAGGRGEGADAWVQRKVDKEIAAIAARPRPPEDMDSYKEALESGAKSTSAMNVLAAAAAISQARETQEQRSYFRGVGGEQAKEIMQRLLLGEEQIELGTFSLTSVSGRREVSERFITYSVESVSDKASRFGVVVEIPDVPKESIAFSYKAFGDSQDASYYNSTLANEAEYVLLTDGGLHIPKENIHLYLDGEETTLERIKEILAPEPGLLGGGKLSDIPAIPLSEYKPTGQIFIDTDARRVPVDMSELKSIERQQPIVMHDPAEVGVKDVDWNTVSLHLAGGWMLKSPVLKDVDIQLGPGQIIIEGGDVEGLTIREPDFKPDPTPDDPSYTTEWRVEDYKGMAGRPPNRSLVIRKYLMQEKTYIQKLNVLPSHGGQQVDVKIDHAVIEDSNIHQLTRSAQVKTINTEIHSGHKYDESHDLLQMTGGKFTGASERVARSRFEGTDTDATIKYIESSEFVGGHHKLLHASGSMLDTTFRDATVDLNANVASEVNFDNTTGSLIVSDMHGHYVQGASFKRGSDIVVLPRYKRKDVAGYTSSPDFRNTLVADSKLTFKHPYNRGTDTYQQSVDRYTRPPKDNGWGNMGSAALPSLYLENFRTVNADLSDSYFPHIFSKSPDWKNTKIENADLPGLHSSAGKILNSSFKGTNLKKAVFYEMELRGTSFAGADLDGASFVDPVDLDLSGSKGEVKVAWLSGEKKDNEHFDVYKDGVFVEKRKVQTTPKAEEKPKENNG